MNEVADSSGEGFSSWNSGFTFTAEESGIAATGNDSTTEIGAMVIGKT